MAEIYIDGERIQFEDTASDARLSDFVVMLEEELAKVRRYISELWVDGRRVETWRETEVMGAPLSGGGAFSFKTGSAESLALEGIETVQEYLRHIRENAGDCSRGLRLSGKLPDRELVAVFEGMIELVKLLDSLSKSSGKYSMDVFKTNPAHFYGPSIDCLEALRDARTSGDMVLTADILEHELAPLLERMENEIFHSGSA